MKNVFPQKSQNCNLEDNIQKTLQISIKHEETTEAQDLQKQQFRFRSVDFLQFWSTTQKVWNTIQKLNRMTRETFQIGARWFPKAMQKRLMKMDTNKIVKNPL